MLCCLFFVEGKKITFVPLFLWLSWHRCRFLTWDQLWSPIAFIGSHNTLAAAVPLFKDKHIFGSSYWANSFHSVVFLSSSYVVSSSDEECGLMHSARCLILVTLNTETILKPKTCHKFANYLVHHIHTMRNHYTKLS